MTPIKDRPPASSTPPNRLAAHWASPFSVLCNSASILIASTQESPKKGIVPHPGPNQHGAQLHRGRRTAGTAERSHHPGRRPRTPRPHPLSRGVLPVRVLSLDGHRVVGAITSYLLVRRVPRTLDHPIFGR